MYLCHNLWVLLTPVEKFSVIYQRLSSFGDSSNAASDAIKWLQQIRRYGCGVGVAVPVDWEDEKCLQCAAKGTKTSDS